MSMNIYKSMFDIKWDEKKIRKYMYHLFIVQKFITLYFAKLCKKHKNK